MDALLSLDQYESSSEEEGDVPSSGEEEEVERKTSEEAEEKASISAADLLLEQTSKPSFITEHAEKLEKDKRMKERLQTAASRRVESKREETDSTDALRKANRQAMQAILGDSSVSSETTNEEQVEGKKKKRRQRGDNEDSVNLHIEKVKNKRLKGQSGIGEEFRVWRSDEEMRLRQQFDS